MAPSTKSGKKAAPVSLTTMAKLKLPVSRIGKSLKKGRYTRRVSPTAAVFLTAVIEYCTSELLKLSGEAAKVTAYKKRINKKGESHEVAGKTTQHQIRPRHITLAVSEDEDLGKLLSHVTIAGGGVAGGVHGAVAEKSATKSRKKSAGSSGDKKKSDKKKKAADKKKKDAKKASPKKSSPKKGSPKGSPRK